MGEPCGSVLWVVQVRFIQSAVVCIKFLNYVIIIQFVHISHYKNIKYKKNKNTKKYSHTFFVEYSIYPVEVCDLDVHVYQMISLLNVILGKRKFHFMLFGFRSRCFWFILLLFPLLLPLSPPHHPPSPLVCFILPLTFISSTISSCSSFIFVCSFANLAFHDTMLYSTVQCISAYSFMILHSIMHVHSLLVSNSRIS